MTTGANATPELGVTAFLDHDSDEVREFVRSVLTSAESTPHERAIRLYYAVRDQVRYEVYGADLSRDGLRASHVVRAGTGMCIHKSVLYAAALRAVGIASRLVLTDVRNHLASDRLKTLLGGDVFHYHCLTSVHLAGKWVKATPTFNKTLCRLYGITPLEFDGTVDSIHHPFDLQGRKHMEFLRNHGEFDDLPYDLIINGLRGAHPRLFTETNRFVAGSLTGDARPRLRGSHRISHPSADNSPSGDPHA
jgi:transglutaminase-like putative cysteine protease